MDRPRPTARVLDRFAEELSQAGVSEARLRWILEVILQDGDDPEFTLRTRVDSVVALTPVERALRCVGNTLRRLRERAMADSHEGPTPYRIQDLPQLSTVRTLLGLTLSEPKRVFSSLERARLFQQWSVVALHCDRGTSTEPDDNVWKRAAERRAELERMCDVVGPRGGDALAIVRNRARYGRAMSALFQRPPDFRTVGENLRQLIGAHHGVVPRGLYFHIMDAFIRMLGPLGGRRWRGGAEILTEGRRSLALAFGAMGPTRAIDRLGILHLLALDCYWCEAPKAGSEFLRIADSIARDIVDDGAVTDWTRLKIRNSASRLRTRMGLAPDRRAGSPDDDPLPPVTLSMFHGILGTDVALRAGEDLSATYDALEGRRFDNNTRKTLYRDVLQSWIGWAQRRFHRSDLAVQSPSFQEHIEQVLRGPLRQDRGLGRVLCIGQICRLLVARDNEQIDDTLLEFDNLVVLSVLAQDWQGLIDTVGSLGHHNFLERKLAFRGDAERLRHLCAYFEGLFSLAVRHPTERAVQAVLEELTGSSAGRDVAFLASEIEGINLRWRAGRAIDEDETVQQWASHFRQVARRAEFTPKSLSQTVGGFFQDVGRLRELEVEVAALKGEVPTDAVAALAWSCYNIARVFRWASRENEVREWIARGTKWAEVALARAELHHRQTGRGAALLHRSIDARDRLDRLQQREPPERRRQTMLRLSARRLASTRFVGRRHRATAGAEISLSQFMSRSWCGSFTHSVPLDEISGLFGLVQRLKGFNCGLLQLMPEGSAKGDRILGDGMQERIREDVIGDDATDPLEGAPDVFERRATYEGQRWSKEALSLLASHLKTENAAVLEFVSYPGSENPQWKEHLRCLIVRSAGDGLVVRPVVLTVPEHLIQKVATRGDGTEKFAGGLAEHLPYWPVEPPADVPGVLRELEEGICSPDLLEELSKVRRLYLCPHRYLFQVPIHALRVNGRPLYEQWDVSYAIKATHIVSLLRKRRRSGRRARGETWSLVDTSDAQLRGLAEVLERWTQGNNHWGEHGVTSDELLRRASCATTVLILCHGQADRDRPGGSRLRLWGGGRLLADDIHRVSSDYGETDWIVGACDTGHARVRMQTGPGFALGLVTSGARRVTSCLYRITPGTAARFVSALLNRRDAVANDAFTAACRVVSRAPQVYGWADAAAFTSYGLFGS